jgi:glycosyltransferase involved in cell wall biosynthesis
VISVLHVGPDPADGAVGGMAAVIRTLVATAPYPASAVPTYWRSGPRPLLLLRSAWAVLRGPAVVHVHLSEGGSWVREGAFVLLARVSGRAVAVTLHGALLGSWVARSLPRTLVRAVLRLAHVVFALHDGDAELVRRLSPRTPVLVVANPVMEWIRAAERHESTPCLVFAGEQSHRKGLDVLAVAWPLVRARCPSARLVVAGPARGAAVGGPGVENLGVVPPARVRELLREASAVVLPSRAEALPMVLLEAMAEGTPFVASAVAGVPRLAATGGGLLVPAGDAVALADAAVRLLTRPGERAAAGKAAHRWWADHAAPPAVHAALCEGYRLARRRARRRSR